MVNPKNLSDWHYGQMGRPRHTDMDQVRPGEGRYFGRSGGTLLQPLQTPCLEIVWKMYLDTDSV